MTTEAQRHPRITTVAVTARRISAAFSDGRCCLDRASDSSRVRDAGSAANALPETSSTNPSVAEISAQPAMAGSRLAAARNPSPTVGSPPPMRIMAQATIPQLKKMMTK